MSFQLEVQFSGLAVYVVDQANGRTGVLMPDCRKPTTDHPDDTPAEPHVGYIRFNFADIDAQYPAGTETAFRKSPEYELIHRFDRELLHFVGTFGDEPTVYTPLDIPDFSEFASQLRLIPNLFTNPPNPAVKLLMRTTLPGGTLVSEDATEEDLWKIPRRFMDPLPPEPYVRQYASSVRWTRIVESPELVVRITDFGGVTTEEFTLRPKAPSTKVVVKIANLCANNPIEWSEFRFRRITGRDVDFKWLYRLLEVPGKTYKEVLLDDELPVPEFVGDQSSGSDDCMPGKITGTVPEALA